MQKAIKKVKNFKKKARAIVLLVIFILTIVQPVTLNVNAGSVANSWTDNGNYDTSWYNTTDTTFTLTTAGQLAGLAVLNNGLNGQALIDFAGKTIKMGANIDLTGHLWTPIGIGISICFNGNFDGNGYDISNIQINSSSLDFQGLFGVNKGTIQNINVKSGTIIGKRDIGGIVGWNIGIVKGCSNSATVSGSDQVGGITGNIAFGKVVTNCYNTGKVTSTIMCTGGIAGEN